MCSFYSLDVMIQGRRYFRPKVCKKQEDMNLIFSLYVHKNYMLLMYMYMFICTEKIIINCTGSFIAPVSNVQTQSATNLHGQHTKR